MSELLAVDPGTDALLRARARELGRALFDPRAPAALVLRRHDDKLAIAWSERGRPGPVAVDFTSWLRRAPVQNLRGQLLARALGRSCRTIVDATAGLGRDALVFAAAGCEVLALERDPALYLLLEDGLTRALADPGTRALAARITPRLGDARRWLRELTPDAVYLDPMFTETGSAAVKKEMQCLRALLRDEVDPELLPAALAAARQRVIVKRARKAPALGGEPSFAILGTRVRFDVYVRA